MATLLLDNGNSEARVYDHAGIGAASAQDSLGSQGRHKVPDAVKGEQVRTRFLTVGFGPFCLSFSVAIKERKCPSPVHAAGDKSILGGRGLLS
jgi:hypothetical protein